MFPLKLGASRLMYVLYRIRNATVVNLATAVIVCPSVNIESGYCSQSLLRFSFELSALFTTESRLRTIVFTRGSHPSFSFFYEPLGRELTCLFGLDDRHQDQGLQASPTCTLRTLLLSRWVRTSPNLSAHQDLATLYEMQLLTKFTG